MKYKNIKLGEAAEITMGQSPKSTYYNKEGMGIPFIQGVSTFGENYPRIETYTTEYNKEAQKGDLLFSVRAPVGRINVANQTIAIGRGLASLKVKKGYSKSYIYYLFKKIGNQLDSIGSGTVFSSINKKELINLKIRVPEKLHDQCKIADRLRKIDEKIEINNHINDNLLELNNKVFSKIFCDEKKFIEAQKIANIKIGKTPPRKEKNWFSSKGITWVSISDMKTNVPFINSSKEQISLKAIKKFNITKVKPKTIILSFKLTIGRVKIASSTLTTNEAIVEFNDAQLPYQFLYSYLKKFNFEALGNTSSIAKALNSKIIKKMPIMLPSRKSLNKYILFSTPIFHFLEEKQIENSILNNVKRELLQQYF